MGLRTAHLLEGGRPSRSCPTASALTRRPRRAVVPLPLPHPQPPVDDDRLALVKDSDDVGTEGRHRRRRSRVAVLEGAGLPGDRRARVVATRKVVTASPHATGRGRRRGVRDGHDGVLHWSLLLPASRGAARACRPAAAETSTPRNLWTTRRAPRPVDGSSDVAARRGGRVSAWRSRTRYRRRIRSSATTPIESRSRPSMTSPTAGSDPASTVTPTRAAARPRPRRRAARTATARPPHRGLPDVGELEPAQHEEGGATAARDRHGRERELDDADDPPPHGARAQRRADDGLVESVGHRMTGRRRGGVDRVAPRHRQVAAGPVGEPPGREVDSGTRGRGGRRQGRSAQHRAHIGVVTVMSPAASRPQPAQGSGSEALRQRVNGQPVGRRAASGSRARPPRRRWGRRRSGPGRRSRPAVASMAARWRDVGTRARGGPHVGRQPRPGGVGAGDGVAESLARTSRPAPVVAEVGITVAPGMPSRAMSRVRSARHCVDLRGREPVGLVEHDHGHRVVGREGRDVVVVEAGVGVLLRVGDPDEDVDELEDALGLDPVRGLARVEVGQVEQDEAVEGPDRPGARPSAATWWRVATPSQSSRAPAGRRPRRGGGRGRRGPAGSDRGDVGADEGVEERGLATARGAGEGDDRVTADEGGALADLGDDGVGPGARAAGSSARRCRRRPGARSGGGQRSADTTLAWRCPSSAGSSGTTSRTRVAAAWSGRLLGVSPTPATLRRSAPARPRTARRTCSAGSRAPWPPSRARPGRRRSPRARAAPARTCRRRCRLGAGEATGARERHEHEEQADAVDAVCRDAGVGASVPPRCGRCRGVALPLAHQASTRGLKSARAWPARGGARGAGRRRAGGATREPSRTRPLGAGDQEVGDAGLERLAEVLGGRRLTLDGGGELSRHLDSVDSIWRKNSPVPTNSCQRARTSPRSRVPSVMPSLTCWSRVGVGRRRPRRSARRGSLLVTAGEGAGGAARERAHGALEGLADDDGAGPGVAGEGVEPAPSRPTARRGGPSASSATSGTVKIGAVGRPCSRSIAARWGRISSTASGGDAVEDDGDGRAPLGGGAQQVPRDGVGVAGGGRDEEPEVGGGQQLAASSRLAGRPSRCRGRRAGPCRPGGRTSRRAAPCPAADSPGPPGDAREAGEDALVGEPLRSWGWCTSTGLVVVGRSTPDAADLGADDGVDEGRLAGAGGPSDDREERGVDGAQPRQDVVVELLEELAAGGLRGRAARHLQGQGRVGDGVAQALDSGDQRPHVPVHAHPASLSIRRWGA